MNRKPSNYTKVDNVKTVGTPDFNRNADGKKKTKLQIMIRKREKLKTADTAQLGLYMMLLLGSLALLVRKYRAGRLFWSLDACSRASRLVSYCLERSGD